MRLDIVTPEANAYSDEVDMVMLPGVEGEMGIFPNHAPLMTQLRPGELRIVKSGEISYLAVGEGFAEITQDHVSVLTDMAMEEAAIEEDAVQQAIDRARKRMAEQDLGDEEVAAVEATIQRSLAQLNVKRRRRGA